MSRLLREPPTVRTAASVIVIITTGVVVLSALLMRIFDPHNFPNIGVALWWAVQTATTVGYGDVVPKTVGGRLVGAFVMLEGIALLTIITAAITSTFVARAQQESGVQRQDLDDARFGELASRLERIEQLLEAQNGSPTRAGAAQPSRTAPPADEH